MSTTDAYDSAPQTDASEREPVPPIQNRFLFVDVAAQRAKQLRRGALPRLPHLRADPAGGQPPETPVRLERVAMDEVRQGLIDYALPDVKPSKAKDAS